MKPVLEMAVLDIQPAKVSEYENAFSKAQPLIASMPGYVSHELRRCVEDPNQYLLLIQWNTVEDHENFRKTPEFQEWRSLLHHFYDPFPTVRHYSDVTPD